MEGAGKRGEGESGKKKEGGTGRRGRRRRGGGGRSGAQGQVPGGPPVTGCAVLSGRSGLSSKGVKVVVRLLPPNLTEEGFLEVAKAASEGFEVEWCNFVPGKTGKRLTGAPPSSAIGFRNSRCYLSFKSVEMALKFEDIFNGYRFPDGKNLSDYRARVERAPLQRIPVSSKRKEKNKLEGTLKNDGNFKAFLEEWAEEVQTASNTSTARFDSVYSAGSQKSASTREVIVTPLMAELRARRREKEGKKSSSKSNKRGNSSGNQSTSSIKSKSKASSKSGAGTTAETDQPNSNNLTILKRTQKDKAQEPSSAPAEKKRSSRRRKGAKAPASGGTNGKLVAPTVSKPKNDVTQPKILKPTKSISPTTPADQLWVAKPTKKS
ncbi:hypothetical protein NDN08_002937 [Rhodosorus marinus]|uniref:UPF3 domain-containing protein n=1 Tax=Rhodosorus marinus TaxID=101924 RepID=A0AAV8UWL7_9RHOD|nr:hypothetical protein NDN08_002937 [Rhodosorus marinus]